MLVSLYKHAAIRVSKKSIQTELTTFFTFLKQNFFFLHDRTERQSCQESEIREHTVSEGQRAPATMKTDTRF